MDTFIAPNVNSQKCLVQIIKQMVYKYLQKEAHNILIQHDLRKWNVTN